MSACQATSALSMLCDGVVLARRFLAAGRPQGLAPLSSPLRPHGVAALRLPDAPLGFMVCRGLFVLPVRAVPTRRSSPQRGLLLSFAFCPRASGLCCAACAALDASPPRLCRLQQAVVFIAYPTRFTGPSACKQAQGCVRVVSAPPKGRVSRLVGADDLRLAKSPVRTPNFFPGTQAPQCRPKPSLANIFCLLPRAPRAVRLAEPLMLARRLSPLPCRSTRACCQPDTILPWRWSPEPCVPRRLQCRRTSLFLAT